MNIQKALNSVTRYFVCHFTKLAIMRDLVLAHLCYTGENNTKQKHKQKKIIICELESELECGKMN